MLLKTKILGYANYAYNRYVKRQIKHETELKEMLDDYLQKTKSTGCGHIDYWELYRCIRKHRPQEVLECGTGVTTVVIAYALSQNIQEGFPGRVTSLEEIPLYFDMAKSIFPKSLEHLVDFVCSPRIEDTYSIFRGIRYQNIPQKNYDFVFVDGPDYVSPTDNDVTFDFDFIHVVKTSSAKQINGMIDKRVSTCFVLQKIFGKEKVYYNALKGLGFLTNCKKTDLHGINRTTPSESFIQSFQLIGNSQLDLRIDS